ncbi:hypothetical protein KC345_g9999 [Hortaea werneckii]|nr:hypothetical protein KC345_g9999 [Hortaea werneckii]
MLCLLLILYFIIIAGFEIRSLAEVTLFFLLEGTPIWAVILPFIWLGTYLVYGGINSIARVFQIAFPISIMILLISYTLSFRLFDIDHLRPVLGNGLIPVFRGLKSTILVFTGCEVTMTLVAFMQNPKQAVKAMLAGIAIPLGLYFLTVVMVIGGISVDSAITSTWPTIDLMRSFEIPGFIFERMEFPLMVIWLMQMFCNFSSFFFQASLGISQIFRLKVHPIIYALVPVIFISAMLPQSTPDLFALGDAIGKMGLVLFLLLPVLLSVIWLIRVKGLKQHTSCWSSKEIEDLALYAGLSLDTGELTPTEQALQDQGATFPKKNKLTATIQLVPGKSVGGNENQTSNSGAPYLNVSGTSDSLLEIFRQYSLRLDRPIIGHHLKVIIVSIELVKQQKMNQIMDFVLRDNDIRPSTMVFLSQGRAAETLTSKEKNEIPAFHIRDMTHNQKRSSKVLDPVILSKLDALMHSKRSYALQNLVTANGEVDFSGAGIIKGDSGHWVGALNQEDTECLSWLTNEGQTGLIKAYGRNNQPMVYELKAMKSKITAKTDGSSLAFEVKLTTNGRLSESWNGDDYPSATQHVQEAEHLFKEKLEQMMQALMKKLQSDYKTDVAGFGSKLSIQEPAVWNKVKDHWDDVFSRTPVHITVELKVTDFGSFTQ